MLACGQGGGLNVLMRGRVARFCGGPLVGGRCGRPVIWGGHPFGMAGDRTKGNLYLNGRFVCEGKSSLV